MAKKHYSERNLKFETLQLHVGQESPDPVTDARAVPNVILSPHMAFYTEQAVSDMVENSIRGLLGVDGEGSELEVV